FSRGCEVSCSLGISRELVVLLDLQAKEVVFHCFCHDVLGWSPDGCHLRLFYGAGDHVALRAPA
ncbi:SI1L3 protein, partial [Alcedo cyanopectus]|nr:SI1L3 protein [Ceyx cyanopectus]